MSAGFTLLWSKILDSSIWMESKEARLVWITMLASKNSDGNVFASPKALAHRARVEPEACAEALKKFLSPDPESTSKEDEGRRIREIPGGWFIINHEEYRFSTEAKREFWKEQKRKQREAKAAEEARADAARKKALKVGGGGSANERLAVQEEKRGEPERAEMLAGRGTPRANGAVPAAGRHSAGDPVLPQPIELPGGFPVVPDVGQPVPGVVRTQPKRALAALPPSDPSASQQPAEDLPEGLAPGPEFLNP